jgi:hypothetical protein
VVGGLCPIVDNISETLLVKLQVLLQQHKGNPTPNSSPTNYTQASLDGGDTYS